MEVVLAWTEAHHPDILCVQETKVRDEEFPLEPLRAAGWSVLFRGEKSYNGVAILSRRPADASWAGLDDGGPADPTRLLAAQFGNLTVINTYVPQGRELTHERFAYKLAWFRRLRSLFDRRFRPEDLVLWCGDLNVAREPIDVHSPERHTDHVCFHESVRREFEACLRWGFVDVYRMFHPEAGRYSFFDYRTPQAVERGIGWRIDYLFASPALAACARGADIDVEPRRAAKPSDHTFLSADFEIGDA